MEKKVYELNIDPELRDYIPPLSQVEFDLLRESIVEEGCSEPLSVWNGTIVDGHNRYKICHENNIPFEYREMIFNSKQDAMFWMAKRQLGRRNLKPFQRCELVYPLEKQIREEVEKRRRAAISNTKKGVNTGLVLDQCRRTGDYMAEYADISKATWYKSKALIENVADEIKEELRKDKVTINAAYNAFKNQEKKAAEKLLEEKETKQVEDKETKQLEENKENPPIDAHASYLEGPLEVPDLQEEPERTPKPYPYVKDQVHFAIENMLKELAIGLSWLRDEDMDKAGELLEMLENGCERASKLIKAGGKK